MIPNIHVGCSGWNYRHWRGVFYPDHLRVKRWFSFYAEQFDTVEINNSFYRQPKAATFEKWRDQAPPGFRYAVKANRFLTQAKKLRDCEEPVERMMAPTRLLGQTLGPILYQLPPMLGINLERLEAFLALLPDDLTHAFEFRHQSWYTEGTFRLLDRIQCRVRRARLPRGGLAPPGGGKSRLHPLPWRRGQIPRPLLG